MRRAFLPALLALTAAAQSSGPAQQNVSPASVPKAQNGSFASHEELEYGVEWRLWNAGRAKLSWYSSPAVKNGWEAKLHLESIGVVSRLFHVDDDYTAQMTSDLCATSTYMTAREGSRTRDTKVSFDASARKADFYEKDLKTNAVVKKQIDIPACVHDIIGGLYILRTLNLEPGKTGQIPISNGKKTVYMKVESQRREEIKVPVGTRKTIRFEVFAFDNQLYNKTGHLHVWLSDDSRRIPVQIEVRLQFAIGTVTLKLDKETQS